MTERHLAGTMRYTERLLPGRELRYEVFSYNRLHEQFDYGSNIGLVHCLRALRTKPISFLFEFNTVDSLLDFYCPNTKILCARYSRHVKGSLVRKSMLRKNFDLPINH